MLYMKLEVIPHGQWEHRYPTNEVYIANVGGNQHKGNYHVWFDQDPTCPGQIRPTPDLEIKRFKRDKGALELLRKALNLHYAKTNRSKK